MATKPWVHGLWSALYTTYITVVVFLVALYNLAGLDHLHPGNPNSPAMNSSLPLFLAWCEVRWFTLLFTVVLIPSLKGAQSTLRANAQTKTGSTVTGD